LSTTPCGPTFACTAARQKKVAVDVGATSATVVIDQLHPGDYVINVLLDRDRNLAETLFPATGDGVAAPDGTVSVVGAEVNTAKAIVFTL